MFEGQSVLSLLRRQFVGREGTDVRIRLGQLITVSVEVYVAESERPSELSQRVAFSGRGLVHEGVEVVALPAAGADPPPERRIQSPVGDVVGEYHGARRIRPLVPMLDVLSRLAVDVHRLVQRFTLTHHPSSLAF